MYELGLNWDDYPEEPIIMTEQYYIALKDYYQLYAIIAVMNIELQLFEVFKGCDLISNQQIVGYQFVEIVGDQFKCLDAALTQRTFFGTSNDLDGL